MSTPVGLEHWQSFLAASIDKEQPAPGLDTITRSHAGAGLAEGCGVYRGSSRGGRQQALDGVFPVCRQLLGDACFDGLAREFVRRHPSRQPDLNRFGQEFPGFISTVIREQPAFSGLPWLPDISFLEWLQHSLYYRANDPPSNLALLSGANSANIRLFPSRQLAWMHSVWPVHRIWQAHQHTEQPGGIEVETGDWFIVVERIDFQAHLGTTDSELWYLLEACQGGVSIEGLAADPNAEVARLGELLLRGWIIVSQAPSVG